MANITNAENTPEDTVHTSNGTVKLTDKNCFSFLKGLSDKGYKASTTLTIAEGAHLRKCYDVLTDVIVDTKRSKKDLWEDIQRALLQANKDGAFTIDDAAIIHRLCLFIDASVASKFIDSDKKEVEL